MPPIKTPPASFSEPVILHKLFCFYLSLHERVLKFPKHSRYTLGVRAENTVIEIIELTYLALSKSSPSRLLILNRVDIKLKLLTVHLRLAHKTRSLNDAGFAELAGQIVVLGKMLGGWIKQTKTRK